VIKLVGLGLSLDTLTIRDIVELTQCDIVYIDSYTSLWFPSVGVLEEILLSVGLDVRIAKRRDLEGEGIDRVIEESKNKCVCIAVPGDPMVATTHVAIAVEAAKRGVETVVVPSMSILNAIASATCLQVYRFGKVVTVVKPKNGVFYEYPMRVLAENRERNLHTPLLLEIDVENGYYMNPREAFEILLEAQKRMGLDILRENDVVIILKDVGSANSRIEVTELREVLEKRYENGLYTLIVPAKKLHPIEEECLEELSRGRKLCLGIGTGEQYTELYRDLVKRIVKMARSAFNLRAS